MIEETECVSSYVRLREAGGTFFFTVVTHDRRPFLTSPLARRCLRTAWKETYSRYPFELVAVTLLPDHLHCLWTLPEGDSDYSSRWRFLKARFSMLYLRDEGCEGVRSPSRERSGERAVWQRRFWEHAIRNDEDLRRHFDYIHYNSVKHGLVARPEEWPWSTFHRYAKLGWYDVGWEHLPVEKIGGMECE